MYFFFHALLIDRSIIKRLCVDTENATEASDSRPFISCTARARRVQRAPRLFLRLPVSLYTKLFTLSNLFPLFLVFQLK